jgi:hypothetical protein
METSDAIPRGVTVIRCFCFYTFTGSSSWISRRTSYDRSALPVPPHGTASYMIFDDCSAVDIRRLCQVGVM